MQLLVVYNFLETKRFLCLIVHILCHTLKKDLLICSVLDCQCKPCLVIIEDLLIYLCSLSCHWWQQSSIVH